MRTLYIPTTTLNFNNILSTESISPKAFYALRGYGYSHWFTVPENERNNSILLYEYRIKSTIVNPDLEDHPLLIGIQINESELQKVTDGVYRCDHTIYLNPWQTIFVFDSEKHLRTAMSLSDSSLETKMMRLYRKKIIVADFSKYETKVKLVVEDCELNEQAIKDDFTINKLKGLLYGYYIGASLSLPSSMLKKINSLREIKNIIAAISSSSNKIPTENQSVKLRELVKNYNANIPVIQDLRSIRIENGTYTDIVDILKKHGIDIPELLNIDAILSDIMQPLHEDSNRAIDTINNKIHTIENQISRTRHYLAPSTAEIICGEKKFYSMNNNGVTNDKLLSAWINETLQESYVNKNISTYKKQLADRLTYKAKDVIGDNWNDCMERSFLNKLRKHIAGEAFNVEWKNDLLSSLAAVIISGDDWNKLLQFLRSNGLTDYRIAFALYGVIVGFANFVRDFTDIILNSDSDYLSSIYKEFYGQLHNIEIKNVPEITTFASSIVPSSLEEAKGIEKTQKTNALVLKVRAFLSNRKGIRREALNSLESAIIKNGSNIDSFIFMSLLNEYSGWKTKSGSPSKIWSELQHEICPEYEKIVSSKSHNIVRNCVIKKQDGPNLFSGEETSFEHTNENGREGLIVFDNKHIDAIIEIIKVIYPLLDVFTIDTLRKDLVWVLDPKYCVGKSQEELMSLFKKQIIDGQTLTYSKNGVPMDWKNKAYKTINADKIVLEISRHLKMINARNEL